MTKMNKNIITLTASVFFLSLVSIFGRLLSPISGYVSAFFGYLGVLVLTFLWILHKHELSKLKLTIKKREMIVLALGQLGSAAFYLQAILFIDLAVAGLLLYTAPLWVALYYLLTSEEKLASKILLPLTLGFVGIILILGPQNIIHPFRMSIGLLLGVLAGISYAVSFIFARKVKNCYNTATIVFWNHILGVIVLSPLLFVHQFSTSPMTIAWFLGIGLSWTLGYFLLYHALKFVKAQYASIIALLEPVFIALWGIFFFQEAIKPFIVIGGLLLLINVYVINRQIE